jgi:hypothetical protein
MVLDGGIFTSSLECKDSILYFSSQLALTEFALPSHPSPDDLCRSAFATAAAW